MAQLREIKKRMGAVKTIQRITKTMQMIATAKFTASLVRAKNSRPYTETIRGLVGQVAEHAGDVTHPLMTGSGKETKKDLVLVIASDRGLAGAYNSNVLRTANKLLQGMREQGRTPVLEVAGRKAVAFFRFQRMDIATRHAIGDKPQFDAVEAIALKYMDRFVAGEYDSVRVVYMRFISNAKQKPEVLQLLPLTLDKSSAEGDAQGKGDGKPDAKGGHKAGAHAVFEMLPSPAELMNELLPRSVKVSLYQAFLDAVVSENVMRMVAMKAATDNAGGLGRTLKRSYNRARQARITTELNEIVSGAQALA